MSTFASDVFLAAHFLGHLVHILALLWTTYAIKKCSISSLCIHHKPMLIGLGRFTNFHTKLDMCPLRQVLVTHFSANCIPQTCTASSAAWEWMTHLVCSITTLLNLHCVLSNSARYFIFDFLATRFLLVTLAHTPSFTCCLLIPATIALGITANTSS
jgi:hypothetical protein